MPFAIDFANNSQSMNCYTSVLNHKVKILNCRMLFFINLTMAINFLLVLLFLVQKKQIMISRDRLEMEMNMLTSKRVKIECFLV